MRHTNGFARGPLEDTGDDAISQHQKQRKTYHQNHATSELGDGSSVQTHTTAIQSFSSFTSSNGRNQSNASGTYGSSTAAAQPSSDTVNNVKHQTRRPNGEFSMQRPGGADQPTMNLTSLGYTFAEERAVSEGVSLNKQHINQATIASDTLPKSYSQGQIVNDLLAATSNPHQGSQASYPSGVTLHNFLGKVVPQSWSGEWMSIHQKNVKAEVEAQLLLILNILASTPVWAAQSMDMRKTEAEKRLKMNFVETEREWMISHPQVTVSEDTNKFAVVSLINRQLACLTIDVGLERGQVSGLSAKERKRHFSDVQLRAMFKQLVLLRCWTHGRKSFVTRTQYSHSTPSSQSVESSVRGIADQTGNKHTNSTIPSKPAFPQPVASLRNGSSQPAVETRVIVVDEDTGVASVASIGDLPKQPEPHETGGQAEKVLKRKRDAEPSTRRKKPRTSSTNESTSRVASRQLAEPFESQARSNSHIAASQTTAGGVICQPEPSFIDFQANFGTDEIRPPADGTIAPAKLSKSYPIVSGQGLFPATAEAVYGIVSEQERTRELVRHCQDADELMGVDPSRREEVYPFLYVAPGGSDNFGYDDELDVAEDEDEDRSLDSQGLWKW